MSPDGQQIQSPLQLLANPVSPRKASNFIGLKLAVYKYLTRPHTDKTQRHQFNFTTLELFHTVQTTVEREIVFIIKYHDKCFLCEKLGCEIRLFRQLGLLLALSCCPTAGTEA